MVVGNHARWYRYQEPFQESDVDSHRKPVSKFKLWAWVELNTDLALIRQLHKNMK
jgi:hypothetical protein